MAPFWWKACISSNTSPLDLQLVAHPPVIAVAPELLDVLADATFGNGEPIQVCHPPTQLHRHVKSPQRKHSLDTNTTSCTIYTRKKHRRLGVHMLISIANLLFTLGALLGNLGQHSTITA